MGDSRSLLTDPVVPPQPLAGLLAPLRAAGLLVAEVPEADEVVIHRLADDSRDVGPATLFIARKGDHSDGHLFLDTAVQQGAVAAIVDADWLREATASAGEASPATSPLGKGERLPSAVFVPVSDTRAALAEVANCFYANPGASLNLLGVTGTNGKTTTSSMLAMVLTEAGRLSDAKAVLDEVFRLDPRNTDAYANLARLAIFANRWPEAEASARQALELNPALALTWNHLALSLYNQHKLDDAFSAWQRSIELDPTDYDVLFNLGIVAFGEGRLEIAHPALERFLAEAPTELYRQDKERVKARLAQLPR